MTLLGGVISIKAITFLMFSVFIVACLGYALGRITIKGISLGTAGVFIIALLAGAVFSGSFTFELGDSFSTDFKIIENIGLILFVTSVGFIAGPNFFKNLKQNYKSYILLGIIIILAGALTCVACFYIGRGSESDSKEFVAMLVGILSGSLTSTPAFSAAKATVLSQYEDAVTVGHGIAYLFGVVGVVIFVQIIPKLCKADMDAERAKITVVNSGSGSKKLGNLVTMDKFGFMAFSLAALLGILLGSIKIPLSSAGLSGTTFSLTTTGGTLLVALVLGHFGRIGKLNVTIDKHVLEVFREFGLMLFLIGAGIPGGAKFVQYFKAVYFLYGIAMTIVPMIIGYLFARYVLKLSLLNNLGSITGGMTSTPALGTLINVAGTDDVASAYAATYPIALIAVVLASQFIIILL